MSRFIRSALLLIPAVVVAVVWRGSAHEVITTKITFSKEIVRILAKNCMSCHRSGGLAPMALTTYAETRPWAKAIKEEVLERRMPPWHAVAGYGEYANDPTLSNHDLDLLTAWVDGGAPKGEEKDLPDLSGREKEWVLGTPDMLLQPSKAYSVTADGDDEYRCFVLPNDSKEDRWIRAVDLRPGDRSVVHHAFVWLDRSGKAEKLEAEDDKPGYSCFGGPGIVPSGTLGGWVPGQQVSPLPAGIAYLLPAGARLVMQVHYHKSGEAAQDRTQVGLYYSQRPVEKRLRDVAVLNPRLEIPAGEASYRVSATHTFKEDAEVVSVLPHMHLLGKSMEVLAVRPDGTREVLVWVRNYDFNWQNTYVFKKPVSLPAGTRIQVSAYYDNSDGNIRNPNQPPRLVRWGESTRDEMCVAYLTYTLRGENLTHPTASR